jgi:hypothetical protein
MIFKEHFFSYFLVNKYTNMEGWYDAKKVKLGQIGGIEINQKSDTIIIFHRGEQVWLSEYINHINSISYDLDKRLNNLFI